MRSEGWSYRTISDEQREQFRRDAEAVVDVLDVSRPVADPSETPRDVYHSDVMAYQALETLALIAEHRLTLAPVGPAWLATADKVTTIGQRIGLRHSEASGPTIGDAVRACVERIRGEVSDRDP